MKSSERDLREEAFSTRSRILETVDSPNSFVVRTFKRPVIFTQPLMISSPADGVAGEALAGEGGGVQGGGTLHHHTVDGDLFAGLDDDDGADLDLVRVHLDELAVLLRRLA